MTSHSDTGGGHQNLLQLGRATQSIPVISGVDGFYRYWIKPEVWEEMLDAGPISYG